MATNCPSTPPPTSTTTYTPSTPRYGTFGDDYQPYSPPRKSARIGQRARAALTPEPRQTANPRSSPSTPRSSNRGASSSHSLIATPTSPQTAQKKRMPRSSSHMGGRRVSGALDFESTASAASALGIPTPTQSRKMELPRQSASRNSRTTGNGMLPTPAKTPSRSSTISSSAIKSVQRNIFPTRGAPIDEMMPTPKRRGKKGGGFTINSFEAGDDESPIPIYTDSMDRVPSPDVTSDNPFASNYRASPVATRTSKRIKIEVPGEGELDLDDVLGRSDGTVVNFRGRKFFKKYDEPACASGTDPFAADDTDLEAETAAHLPNHRGPVTRSVKPRLLFASAEQIEEKEERLRVNEEEEALTDIEVDMNDASPVASSSRSRTVKKNISFSVKTTPGAQSHRPIVTPKAPRFPAAMATPPTTARITRSRDGDVTISPSGRSTDSEGPETPTRVTGGHAESDARLLKHPQVSKKRVGESLTGAVPDKRARR